MRHAKSGTLRWNPSVRACAAPASLYRARTIGPWNILYRIALAGCRGRLAGSFSAAQRRAAAAALAGRPLSHSFSRGSGPPGPSLRVLASSCFNSILFSSLAFYSLPALRLSSQPARCPRRLAHLWRGSRSQRGMLLRLRREFESDELAGGESETTAGTIQGGQTDGPRKQVRKTRAERAFLTARSIKVSFYLLSKRPFAFSIPLWRPVCCAFL